MKATTLLLAAALVSLTCGTALANRDYGHHERDGSYHNKFVQEQQNDRQYRSNRDGQQHNKQNWRQINRLERKQTRIARKIRAERRELRQRRHQQQRRVVAQQQYRDNYRNNRHSGVRIMLPLPPIHRVAFFFPW